MHPATSDATRKVAQRITGNLLNRKWRLGALHALYHKDGTFYERLTRFPGVLCDEGGYVKYETKEQFDRDSTLNIGVKVNAKKLSEHPHYQPFSPSRS